MRVGVISGSGSYSWPGLENPISRTVATGYGAVELTEGLVGEHTIVHLSRHGAAHARLSNHVDHRANLAGLREAGIDALISLTVCGAVDAAVEPGSLIVFDDLCFPGNRLPDGSLCTWYDSPGAADRGHWIAGEPFSVRLRQALLDAADERGLACVPRGCYGHVDGPRFNTRTEIAALARLGVTAVSQTGGPETVLAGEAEIPMALVGFVTDYANGVTATPEPVEALIARMNDSSKIFAELVAAALPHLAGVRPAGFVYRFAS